MIGRKSSIQEEVTQGADPVGFDDFELKLGDMMRGERATMGKSLLDVQRELRIKAAYVAAIENADPTAFETPGFVAGYVRSYARYLGMDPEQVFEAFCTESGFATAHGMSPAASGASRKSLQPIRSSGKGIDLDPFANSTTPFIPSEQRRLPEIDLRGIGSVLALIAVVGGIGYGGWTLLRQVQQVTLAPVDQVPVVLSDLDPLATTISAPESSDDAEVAGVDSDALNRLYRPQALELPVMTARDAPISTLNPRDVGVFQIPLAPTIEVAEALPVESPEADPIPQVVETAPPSLQLVAVRPSWVRVRSADGSIVFEGIMQAGTTWDVPDTEEPPTLRAGESGAVYFAYGDQHFGPIGAAGVVTKGLVMAADQITTQFDVADLAKDQDLARMVAQAAVESSDDLPLEQGDATAGSDN